MSPPDRILRLELSGRVDQDGELAVDQQLARFEHAETQLADVGRVESVDGTLLALFSGERVRVTIERLEAPTCRPATGSSSPTVSSSALPPGKTAP